MSTWKIDSLNPEKKMKIIFLFIWLIFRFQPLIFQGVTPQLVSMNIV